MNSEIIKKVSENAPTIRIVNGNDSPYGMYIVDGHAFRAELKEPEADNFSEAISIDHLVEYLKEELGTIRCC